MAWSLFSASVSQLCAKSSCTGTQITLFLGSCDFGEDGGSVWILNPKEEVLWALVKFHIGERENRVCRIIHLAVNGMHIKFLKDNLAKELISTGADDFKALKDCIVISFRMFLITETL